MALVHVNKLTLNGKGVYEVAVDDEMREVAVEDTGKRVAVLEWQGMAYGGGEQVLMQGCTLWQDAEGNGYTSWDGESDG